MRKSIKKAIALAVMVAALVAIYTGIGYVNNFEGKETIRTPYTQQSIIIPPKGYGCIRIDINETGDHDVRTTINSTIRTDSLAESDYTAWVNGSYKPLYRSEIGPISSTRLNIDDAYLLSYSTMPWYTIYWNTNASASVEVKTDVYRVTTQTAYNYLNLGVGGLLIGVGAVSGLAAAFWVSKRVLLLVFALALVASGVILFTTYTHKSTFDETDSSKTILVPANGNVTEHIQYNNTGAYLLNCTVDKGIMNATTMTEEDYTSFTQGQREPYWQTWRFKQELSGMSFYYDIAAPDYNYRSGAYLLLANPDAYDKVVTVQFQRYWEGYNYAGLVGGCMLLAGGVILFWYVNRVQIARFNGALDAE